MNNNGVTLVELLIVIVVMGIIAAFAIPSVGTIIENTKKDAIHADALVLHEATRLYCTQNICEDDTWYTWSQLSPYVDNLDETYYDFSGLYGTPGARNVSHYTVSSIEIMLYASNTGDFEWSLENPTLVGREHVTVN